MRVLVLGATGLIGYHVVKHLEQSGYEVIAVGRRISDSKNNRVINFSEMITPELWLPELDGIEAVVNCVGIIRERRVGDFDLLHRAVPVALFAACEKKGIRRVIQVSALGSRSDASTEYWRTKGKAEEDILRRNLNATVIRPSLVYGDDGASSRLFLMLATLPLLFMPMAHRAKVQPIHVEDLAEVIVQLLRMEGDVPRELATVGSHALSLADYLAVLRIGLNAPCAKVFELPLFFAKIMAHCAALHPSSAFTPDSLTMLVESEQGGNTADATAVRMILGHPLREVTTFARPEQRYAAVLSWGLPLIRYVFAALWLITAFVSWFVWPHQQSMEWLSACGIPKVYQEGTLLLASALDMVLGLALIFYPHRRLWLIQMGIVGSYTLIMSFYLPIFWQHPFGILSKNLPILAMFAIMWRITEEKGE